MSQWQESYPYKRLYYFFRNYKFDLLSAALAILIYLLAYKNSGDQFLIAIISILLTIIFLVIFILLRVRDKTFYFSPLRSWSDRQDWIGAGDFKYNRSHNCYEVTNASPGVIYSKCLLWTNYKASFNLKLTKQCLGVIVRAINLSNYVMLQIDNNGVNPHLRINGGWNMTPADHAGLKFSNSLSTDDWHKCEIFVENETVNIKISKQKRVILNRSWDIPQGVMIFSTKDEETKTTANVPYPIDLVYGSFGFRNFGPEKALVRDLQIEKL